MAMVSACFPQARAFLKYLSRLKATRGKYPKSSSRVNSGKKIAMGGSITDTTQASTRYIPSVRASTMPEGSPTRVRTSAKGSSRLNNRLDSSWDGSWPP